MADALSDMPVQDYGRPIANAVWQSREDSCAHRTLKRRNAGMRPQSVQRQVGMRWWSIGDQRLLKAIRPRIIDVRDLSRVLLTTHWFGLFVA